MHPDHASIVTSQHRAELHRRAAEHRLASGATARRASARSLRRRTGWWLVAVGLRLAVGHRRPGLLAPVR